MTQDQALSILKTGANVFLTGEPGAGKTYTINRYIEWLRERGVEPAITASTGIAATHVGGMTLHAWSGIGIKRDLSEWDLEALLEREPLVRRVRGTAVLIIDEVSMLDARLLGLVDRAVRTLRGSEQPFGGLQVIFVGDFFQLPPVPPRDPERSREGSKFAFESPSWEEANPLYCYLSEQHRQEDDAFLELLGALRAGTLTDNHKSTLRARAEYPEEGDLSTRLYPHNADVDRLNDEALAQVDAPVRIFEMRSEGGKALVESLKRGCLSPQTLALKEGAAVMFTRNNFEKGYVNGTLGVVTNFAEGGFPTVRTREGRVIEAAPEEWRLDSAVMDLRQAFEYGQGYVALSRVRSLKGLYLSGFNERALRVHPGVLKRDASFRSASAAAAAAFAAMPVEELAALHKQFVQKSGGREPSMKDPKNKHTNNKQDQSSKLEMMREKHPNAYRPWSKEDDARLTELFRNEATVLTLVKEFGRQRGAINSRLIRLGLVEPDL